MRPINGAGAEPVNWLNYKTGIKHLYFRMDADHEQASIAIELYHPDPLVRQQHFEKFRQLEKLLHQTLGEHWEWKFDSNDEEGRSFARIGIQVKGVSIFNTGDWSAIISFLKPRMLALDEFWNMVKDGFDQ